MMGPCLYEENMRVPVDDGSMPTYEETMRVPPPRGLEPACALTTDSNIFLKKKMRMRQV